MIRTRVCRDAVDGHGGVLLVGEVEVVGDVEIEIAVGIHVQEAGPGADLVASRDAGRVCHVGERPVAVVAIENVGAEIVHVEVRKAVVVVVAHCHPQAVCRLAQPRVQGDIGEVPAAIAAIQRMARLRRGRAIAEGNAAEKKNVEIPVGVVVERSQTGADGFDDVMAAAAAVGVDKGDAGLRSRIVQLNRERRGVPLARRNVDQNRRRDDARQRQQPEPGPCCQMHHLRDCLKRLRPPSAVVLPPSTHRRGQGKSSPPLGMSSPLCLARTRNLVAVDRTRAVCATRRRPVP